MQKRLLPIRTGQGASLTGFLFLLCLCLLAACADDGTWALEHPDESGSCLTTLRLDVGGYASGNATKAIVGGSDDENLINDIWVFQFNAETGESLHEPVYLDDFNSNDIEVNLSQNSDGSQSRICIVANTGDEYWAKNADGTTVEGFKIYDSFLQQAIPAEAAEPFLSTDIGNSTENGRAIPMSGTSKDMAITSKCYVSVPLYRMLARVDVEVEDLSTIQQLGMTIEKLYFSNIPAYCRVGTLELDDDTQMATYPDNIWNEEKYDCGNTSGAILYVPENLQGKVNDMTSKQEADKESIPEHALAIHLLVSYGEGKEHTYTVYPGLDTENDFNVKRNHIYDVNLDITKLPESTN